jgi:hypothetical protein
MKKTNLPEKREVRPDILGELCEEDPWDSPLLAYPTPLITLMKGGVPTASTLSAGSTVLRPPRHAESSNASRNNTAPIQLFSRNQIICQIVGILKAV